MNCPIKLLIYSSCYLEVVSIFFATDFHQFVKNPGSFVKSVAEKLKLCAILIEDGNLG